MSKAFTRELDDAPEPVVKPPPALLPPGVKNYFTAQGAQRIRRELQELSAQLPAPQIRQRIYELQQQLQSAVVVEAPPRPWTQVLFGATVGVRNQAGETMAYTIVGAAETDLDKNHISWLSPIAKALLKKRIGERVRFMTPGGEQNWQIISLMYKN